MDFNIVQGEFLDFLAAQTGHSILSELRFLDKRGRKELSRLVHEVPLGERLFPGLERRLGIPLPNPAGFLGR